MRHAPTLSLLALSAILAIGTGCEEGSSLPPVETVTPEAVERFRTRVVVDLQDVDASIAALEGTADQADSAAAAAYSRALASIRQERQRIQTALDTLHGTSTDAFDVASAEVLDAVDALERRVDRAPIELAPNAAALRQAALTRLASLEAAALADSSGALPSGELLQRRQQIEGALARLGGPEASFSSIRDEVARLLAALEDRLADAQADAGQTSFPDTTSTGRGDLSE